METEILDLYLFTRNSLDYRKVFVNNIINFLISDRY